SNSVPVPVYLEVLIRPKSKQQLLAELNAANMSVAEFAEELMSKPTWRSETEGLIRFARLKIRDLGFVRSPTDAEVWERVKEVECTLCEPGDGPQIRLALTDQAPNDRVWVPDGTPYLFQIMRWEDGKHVLSGGYTHPTPIWGLDQDILVRLP
ncbi:MAG: hypothetical protein WAX80_00450, partial [Minisyncoccia bacterium]